MTATAPTFVLPGVSFPSSAPNTGRHLAPDYPLLAAHSLPQLGSDAGVPVGVATRAGRFFYEPPGHSQLLPFAPAQYFVVWVERDGSSFTLLNRSISVAELAERITACREWQARPVVLASTGDAAEVVAGLPELAAALGTPVIAADAPISLVSGRILTAGQFLECRPLEFGPSGKRDPEHELVAIGRELPPPVVTAARPVAPEAPGVVTPVRPVELAPAAEPAPAVEAAPAVEPAPAVEAAPVVGPAPADEPEPAVEPDPEPSIELAAVPTIVLPNMVIPIVRSPELAAVAPTEPAPATTGTQAYLTVQASSELDHRAMLRNLLDWRYEAHSRGVTRVLALHPGLRANADTEDVLATLIGTRAYLTDHGDQLDEYLRGTAPSAELEALAACALAGLSRLPAYLGAVYRTGQHAPLISQQLHPGMEIVEPGFLRAAAHPAGPEDTAEVQYAIWGSTARRTDALGLDHDDLVFAAGTRFSVLDVQLGETTTVYLRELGRIDPKLDARALTRLRAALDSAVLTPSTDVLARPIGLTVDGRLFDSRTTELDGASR